MLKKTMTYKNYNGVEITKDFYFNLSKAEILEMELSTIGGITELINRAISAQDTPTLVKVFKELILKSYGVKSPDGEEFIKDEELTKKFTYTEAYSMLFMELATDAQSASDFVNAIIPSDVAAELNKDDKIVQLPDNTQQN